VARRHREYGTAVGILGDWRHCPRCGSPLTHVEGRVECRSCGLAHWAHSAPAVAALLRDDEGCILLARRAGEPDEGLWDTPGGILEEAEDPLDGLRRELLEETGLVVEPRDFVGAFTDTYGDGPDATPVLNLVWEATVSGGEVTPADDVSEVRWFPRDALPADGELAFRWLAPALRAWASSA
jgi:ADP-ribose pyrophosphatase YjhB (NUDIX family)